jgi:hypothetical protein
MPVGGPVRRVVRMAWCLAAGALTLIPARVVAQGIAGDAGAFNIQRRLSYQGGVYEQTGVAVGAAGAARLGPVILRVSGLFGTLKGDGGALNPDVKVRTTAVRLEVAVQPWLALGAVAEARRFEADAGVTTWKLLGAAARLEPGLGLPGLRGLADVAVLPAASVAGGAKAKMALQTTVGVSYRPARSPFEVRLGYRFERYDFDASGSGPARNEQFRGIVAEAGLRLGRW